jgi:hypothetical protein
LTKAVQPAVQPSLENVQQAAHSNEILCIPTLAAGFHLRDVATRIASFGAHARITHERQYDVSATA